MERAIQDLEKGVAECRFSVLPAIVSYKHLVNHLGEIPSNEVDVFVYLSVV